MKKYIFILGSIGLTYIFPLIDVWELLFETPMIAVISGVLLLLISQPRFSAQEAKSQQESDQNSIYKIQFAAFIGQFMSVLEWRFRVVAAHVEPSVFLFWCGLVFLVGGLALRIWAIRVLGVYFSSVVKIQTDHRLIQRGPYLWIRHPSYLGAFLALLGCMMILQAYYSLVFGGIALLWAYYYRILAEETVLEETLGPTYTQYQDRTYRLFPFIW